MAVNNTVNYKSVFDSIDNTLRREAGCSNELDYVEQTSWLLFLKYMEDFENNEEEKKLLDPNYKYERVLKGFNRWSKWAYPKKSDGTYDQDNALQDKDLVEHVDKLFKNLSQLAEDDKLNNPLKYKISEIFKGIKNKISSASNLIDIIKQIETLKFSKAENLHEMSFLYEDKISQMGNAGRNGGEYYTPRPLIRTIIKVLKPEIGKTIYDPACGSAGFLCEAYSYMHQLAQSEKKSSIKNEDILQKNTFYGIEKKGLPYIIANMNMIFHGIKNPNIEHDNSLAINIQDLEDKDKYDYIFANPPFGGQERDDILGDKNFKIKSSETAYLFMQHFIKKLRAGGKAGIVIKNTFLSNGDASKVRKMLLEECHVDCILDLPQGVFQGAGVKSIVVFFTKGEPSDKIWYYQLNLNRTLGKTNPLNEDDLADFVVKYADKPESENSWTISVSDLNEDFDMSVKNPNAKEIVDTRTPKEIANIILNLSNENNALINEILNLL